MNNEEAIEFRARLIVRSYYRRYLFSMSEAWIHRADPVEFYTIELEARRFRHTAEDVLWTVKGVV